MGGWGSTRYCTVSRESQAISKYVLCKNNSELLKEYNISNCETNVKVVEENLEKLNKIFQVYEEHLSKFKYLARDFICLADLSHFPSAHYLLATSHATILDDFPLLKAWITDMLARPTVKEVIEIMKVTA
uniref:glutathione transferase n=1 Tax=Leersia perrieri TaxID=77586 RepID=A0A0D9V139_9ORYZ